MADFDSKKELAKLKKITESLSPTKKKMCEGIIADASFQAEQLEVLRQHIKKNGWSEEYRNGETQYGKKKSVEADYYVQLQKLYASNIKLLNDMLPDSKAEATSEAGEKLIAYIAKGHKK